MRPDQLSRRTALAITFLCAAWTLSYLVLGTTPTGRTWYGNLSRRAFDDKKRVPLLTLAIPLLVAGSAAALLDVRPPRDAAARRGANVGRGGVFGLGWPRLPRVLGKRWKLARPRWLRTNRGDVDFDAASFWFILVPLLCYLGGNLHRHISDRDSVSADKFTSKIANAFGVTAVVALSMFLVPVSRRGPILDLLGWCAASAVRLHIWAGRIGILGSLIHGLVHMSRWWDQAGWVALLVPPMECWTGQGGNEDKLECPGDLKGCTCYHRSRNFTGLLSLVTMLVIALSSLSVVRRCSYRVFYAIHIIAGPLSLIMAVLHWNKMIFYLCPGIIYYLASSSPLLLGLFENRLKGGVKVQSVTELPCFSDEGDEVDPCIVLDIAASSACMAKYQPGQYLRLSVPGLSFESHPFTANVRLGKDNARKEGCVRVIFRAVGPFTRGLARELLPADESAQVSHTIRAPVKCSLIADGFHGPRHRLDQALSHDVVIMVAGGIGITPYLSLLEELVLCTVDPRDGFVCRTKEICLHWVCRDENLIAYITNEYFEPLLNKVRNTAQASASINIVVHKTGVTTSKVISYTPNSDSCGGTTVHKTGYVCFSDRKDVEDPSVASAGGPTTIAHPSSRGLPSNLQNFVTFSTISWLGLYGIQYGYDNLQNETEVLSRFWPLLFLSGISVAVSWAAGVFFESTIFQGVVSSISNFMCQAWEKVMGGQGTGMEASFKKGRRELYQDLADELGAKQDCEHQCSSVPGDSMVSISCEPGMTEKSALPLIKLHKSTGRPSPHALVTSLDQAKNPGIFLCGPPALMDKVKEASTLRSQMRIQQCLKGIGPAYYEESFEL